MKNKALPWGFWKRNPKNIRKAAQECKSRSECERRFPGAVDAARDLGILQEVFSHMKRLRAPNGTWVNNETNIRKAALKCKTIVELSKRFPNAYAEARKLNILDDVTKHMKRLRLPNGVWNKKYIKSKAQMCKTKSELRQRFPGAYNAAHKLDIIDEVCSHMSPIASDNKRALYVHIFIHKKTKRGYFYIGITDNYNIRLNRHKNSKHLSKYFNSKVYEHSEYRENKWYEPDKARNIEIRLITRKGTSKLIQKCYKDYQMLNKSSGGSLGGYKNQYSDEDLINSTRGYETISEFAKENSSKYSRIISRGLHALAFADIERKQSPHGTYSGNEENLFSIAKQYKTREELRKANPTAHKAIYKMKIQAKAFSHMKYLATPAGTYKGNIMNIKKEAKKYTNRAGFNKGSRGAYHAAQELGIMDDLFPVIKLKIAKSA